MQIDQDTALLEDEQFAIFNRSPASPESGAKRTAAEARPSHSQRRVQTMELSEEQLEWRARALVNLEDRYRAMCTNAELKRIFAHQVALVNTMRNLLKQDETLKGVAFVAQSQPRVDRPFFQTSTDEPMLAELSSNLRADLVLPNRGDTLTVSFSTQAKSNGDRETRIEITQDASSHEPDFNINQLQSSKKAQTPYDRRCVAHLFIQNGQLDAPHYVKALGVYRKYEDKNRVLLVAQARWLVPADGLEFVDKHWTVIEPSPAEPEHSCIVRTYYLLEVKSPGMGFTHQQESTRNLVMRAITEKSRQILQLMQNTFLDQVVESSMLSS
ncbi:hypothetical protein L915_05832 [Phytophthora nicotianae]|uniref:START domain-containing protein n=1 Tax=Phytophthora nicotianae TaxID=4792 RepID=W2H5E1_PHYNI|nr:hypothetical protein L915_05832 [Phytophthora nicotianae]